MPMTLAEMEAKLLRLEARLDRTTTLLYESQKRIEALEKASGPEQLRRIADALNQFGEQQAGLLQNQSVTNNPANPWSPV